MPAIVDSKSSRTVVIDSARTAAIADRRPSRLSVSDRRSSTAVEQRTSTAEVSSPGMQGPPGPAGEGEPGAAGASAYEVALANGFVGTEAEWLASLKGEPGEDGTGGGDAFVPFLVPDGEVFILPANRQAAYVEDITLEGDGALQLEGDLFDQVPVADPAGADTEKRNVIAETSGTHTIAPEESGAMIRCQGFQSGAKLIDFAGGPYELGQWWEVSNYLDSGGISVVATAGGIQFNVPEGLSRGPDNWGEKRRYMVGLVDTINDITYIDVSP